MEQDKLGNVIDELLAIVSAETALMILRSLEGRGKDMRIRENSDFWNELVAMDCNPREVERQVHAGAYREAAR